MTTDKHKKQTNVYYDISLLTESDIYLIKKGNHYRLYEKMGAHPVSHKGKQGTFFCVWAPNAERVSVKGGFNDWQADSHPLKPRDDESGIWEGFIPGVGEEETYKYHIESRHHQYKVDKGDPYAFASEEPPQTASIVHKLDYEWQDSEWMQKRGEHNALDKPFSVYEMHPGSWKRVVEEDNRPLSYLELADQLADYLNTMNFTHVEFLPIMEHPFYGSWGYQSVGYFAPTARYGSPQEFMALIDRLHQHDIGVILDWVPSHFPGDEHGLVYFDGTHLYEHADPRQGYHPDWKSYIFNLGRNEVRNFLMSSAMFWLDRYHIDGLRVDAVASMLYLDYSREQGEWVPNKYGGRENLESISFLRQFNTAVYQNYPDVQTIAEESTAWPMVSRPTYVGGLGFGMKWNMGWMHDVLDYFTHEPIHRKYHHNKLTFGLWYAFNENFMISISHDEVVHGKGSLYNKMPGDPWQKNANLRLLYAFMYGHPGKKLLFMGADIGQESEWNHDSSLEWHLLNDPLHRGVNRWLKELNYFYRTHPALYENDFNPEGFEWIDFHDAERSVISFMRKSPNHEDDLLLIFNFTPMPRENYRIGVPKKGYWREVLNSDATVYGGAGWGNMGGAEAAPIPYYDRFDYSLSLTLPPLGALVLKRQKSGEGQ
ncbi:MAG: 1,4-alpha-glucan branching protein GlgB [candidate division KSB1 bacterium]|nr:1,4-alpha-glucan branching protein GlgB [candidate division KSB1 bacterium]